MSFGANKPHRRDAKIAGDLPNVVEDEEGFEAASFRFYHDAEAYVEAVNGNHPCAEYSIREPVAKEPTPADTGDRVASLAGKYGDFTVDDLIKLSLNDQTGSMEAFCADVRSMAASLRRQNER